MKKIYRKTRIKYTVMAWVKSLDTNLPSSTVAQIWFQNWHSVHSVFSDIEPEVHNEELRGIGW